MKLLLLLPLLFVGLFAHENQSPQDPKELPACTDVSGAEVVWADFDQHAIVLYFHKPGLKYSTLGLQDLVKKLSTQHEEGWKVVLITIGFEDSDLSAAQEAFQQSGLAGAVVLDAKRAVFSNYHVKAYPTAFVLDRAHQEVKVVRGYGPHFVYQVDLAARFGCGQIDQERYELLLAGKGEVEHDPALKKLHRQAGLARRLALGGKPGQGLNLLEKALTEAESVPPDAMVLELAVRLNLLDGNTARAAELLATIQEHFAKHAALSFLECRLALAAGDLKKASEAIKGKRARLQPEAVLLRGLILEAQDECEKATELYRSELEKQALNPR